jgi:hypothetical protein
LTAIEKFDTYVSLVLRGFKIAELRHFVSWGGGAGGGGHAFFAENRGNFEAYIPA